MHSVKLVGYKWYSNRYFETCLTLQQGGCCCHSLWYTILAVNRLEELRNAVVFISNNYPYLRG